LTPSGAVRSNGSRAPVNRYQFHLSITPEQYLDYYRGIVHHVLVRSTAGQTVQFPASFLRRFVTPEGIHGEFLLLCDEHHKCLELRRLSGGLDADGDTPLVA
jgi:hypothetical protein